MGTEPGKGLAEVQAGKDCPATFVSYFDVVELCYTLTETGQLGRQTPRQHANSSISRQIRRPKKSRWTHTQMSLA